MASKQGNYDGPKPTPYRKWRAEIDSAEKNLKKSHERAREVVKRFLDERDMLTGDKKWFNIFHANTVILQSALYSQLPKPVVSRKYKDYQDEVARVAAIIIERNITQDLDDPDDTFDATMRHCVEDRLVPGISQAWLRLETSTEEYLPESQPETEATKDEEQESYLSITDQKVCVDYVFWGDFLFSPCRVWEERRWVGRIVYMDRDELVERWGKDVGNKIPLDFTVNETKRDETQGSTPREEDVKKARIYEIWSRKDRKVLWLSKGLPRIIEEIDDPLGLKDFDPCPRPMLANISTSNTAPRPDFYMIQDQYYELDNINNRISLLVKACKVVGVYDKGAAGVARMLKEGFDNDLVPVDNWAMFAEKGGIKGQVDWLPLEVVVAALVQLNDARERIKAQIYELTGISDIVRGASKASETLGAQEIKAKFASVRIKKLQDEVGRFASDIMRLKAEIMVKHFEPELLAAKSNIMMTEQDPAVVQQAMDLLKDEGGFEWRIDVSADTMAQTDYELEKKERTEFLTAVSGYLEKAGALIMQKPETAPLLTGMLKWAVAGFRNAAEIEGMIDKELDNLTKNPPQPKPDEGQQKMEMEKQKIDAKAQADQQKAQNDLQIAQQKAQIELMQAKMEMQMEQQRLQFEMQVERQKAELEIQKMQMELMFEQKSNQLKLGMEQQMGQTKMALQAAQGQQQVELGRQKVNQELELGEQQHRQEMDMQRESHQQELDLGEESHKSELKHGDEMSKANVAAKKAEAKAVPKTNSGAHK